MPNKILQTTEYQAFIQNIKSQIHSSQFKAHIKVNEEMLKLYWNIGQMIVEKQKSASWGDGFIADISKDLQKEFPDMKGFSTTNIKYMRKWYLYYSISPQAVDFFKDHVNQQITPQIFQIPWGHNREIITKCKSVEESLFYISKTLENGYSRAVLIHQMESNLYARNAKAITNFEAKLPALQSDLARQITKDPYNFDFLTISEKYNERELEDALMESMTNFLLELGQGFAFVGRQYKLNVGGDEFKCDLLFYHLQLECYVVVELKVVPFKPEFAGQLNFYVSAVDGELKKEKNHPTIGILICKSKNNTVVEYALKNVNNPIGVSEYQLTHELPDTLRSSLPSIEAIEAELKSIE